MKKIQKVFYTAALVFALLSVLTIFICASDYDLVRSYFTSAGREKDFFSEKDADSTLSRGEMAEFLSDYVIKSASLGIISEINTVPSFSDGGKFASSAATVYRYGVMLPHGESEFGTEVNATYTELLSAWLSILGYSAEKGDFLYDFPYDRAADAGIVSSVHFGELTFAQMLEVSFRAIGAPLNKKTASLVSSSEYKNTAKNLSPAAKNAPFYGSLGSSSLIPQKNPCADLAYSDGRIEVSVSRGNDTMVLDTYKLTQITSTGYSSPDSIISGKRFSAFSFSGAITVNLTLKTDVFSYEVYSTSSNFSHTFDGGTLSISISGKQTLRVVFNGYTDQEIYIFAGALGTSFSDSEITEAFVDSNRKAELVENVVQGKVYINQHKAEVRAGAFFSSAYGPLVSAYDLCAYLGLDYTMYDFGEEFHFDGTVYVHADAVNEIMGFDECIAENESKSLRYILSDYTFDIDKLELQSASDSNLSLSDDGEGNYRLSQNKSGFGGLIANVTREYGLSNGCLELDFDAFASKSTKIMATLVARGETNAEISKEFNLSGDLRRCSYTFEFPELKDTEHTEIFLIISPADTSYPTGLSYTIAGHTITRQEFYKQTQLVVYPEYPDRVNRIYDYKVTVTQGDRTEQLPVYNHTMWYALGSRTVGGDSYRRFSAFAFSGQQVRVDIKVSQDVDCYSVMPSALGLKSSFKDGVISVYLDQPEYFLIRLNNRDTSILSIFADYPEFHADIPCRDDENVIWIDGWYEPTEAENIVKNGVSIPSTLSITEPDTVLYIAPGAVLNSRTAISSSASNTKVIGRGAIVDPYGNIYKTDITLGGNEGSGYRPLSISANGTYVDGITILDARSFNITAGTNVNGPGVEIRNVKELSTMMTSDGISLYSGSGHLVENCFLYVGDNAFVYSSKGFVVRNCIIGTTCAAFFPQGNTYSSVFENCHVFASYGGLINNRYNGSESVAPESRPQNVHSNTFINLDATDCVYLSWFFQGRNMGNLQKVFIFDGVSVPDCTGVDNIHTSSGGYEIKLENGTAHLYTENYTLKINNMYVGNQAVKSADDLDIQVTKTSTQKVANNTLIFTNDGKYKPIVQHKVDISYTLPDKIFVGSMLAVFEGEVVRINGELAMPADEIVKVVRTQKTPNITQYNGMDYVKASDLVACGAVEAIKEENNCLYITPVYNGENLLLPDQGEVSRYTETTCYQVELLTQKDTDGDWIYVMQPNPKSPNVNAGIARFITDEVKMYGAGTYTLTFSVKASKAGQFKAAVSYDSDTVQYTNFKVHTKDVTTSWQTISVNFEITEEVVQGNVICFRFFGAGSVLDQLLFTDISLVKK